MLEEVNTVQSWIPWPEEYLYDGDGNADWTVFPFCSCVPTNNVNNLKWIERCCDACPKTAAMLRNIGPLRYAMSNINLEFVCNIWFCY